MPNPRHLNRSSRRTHSTSLIGAAVLALSSFPGIVAAAEPPPETPVALYTLAQKYLQGDGVARDEKKTFELARQAADQGHAEALAMLGYCYSVGAGVKKSDVEARRYFSEAAQKGSVAGEGNLGIFLVRGRGGEKDAARGVALLRKAAGAGNQQAAVLLGEIFYFGEHADGQPDFAEAHKLLLGPAEAGQAAAQNMIGVMLKDGRLREADVLGARVWFERAAMQAHGKACFNLGELLWNNRNNDRWTRLEALRWLLLGDTLQEVAATYFLKDLRSTIAVEEWETARHLARLTMKHWPAESRDRL